MAPYDLTERQRFWLAHLRACGDRALKAYAEEHGLSVSSLYMARTRLRRAGLLDETVQSRFVRVQCEVSEDLESIVEPSAGALVVELANGTRVELSCPPAQWGQLFSSLAALP